MTDAQSAVTLGIGRRCRVFAGGLKRPLRLFVSWGTLALSVSTFACDPNGGASTPSAGQGGTSGSSGMPGAGTGGARYTELSPNHYSVTSTASLSSGGSGGSGSGGAPGGAGSAPVGPSCVLQVPSAPLPATPYCGDGYLTGTEECDDGNTLASDACSPTCTALPQLVAPRMAPAVHTPPLRARELGGSRHPLAAGCNSVGMSVIDSSSDSPSLNLAVFSAVGGFKKLVPFGAATVDLPSPAVAAFGVSSRTKMEGRTRGSDQVS